MKGQEKDLQNNVNHLKDQMEKMENDVEDRVK
jgi:hypothetical protein